MAIATPPSVRGEGDPNIAPDFFVSVLPGNLTVNEGGSAQFSVGLSNRPAADVRVVVSIDPEARDRFTVDNALLEFSPDTYHQRQLVRIWALHDDDANDESVRVVFTGLGYAYEGTVRTVNTISVRDDDEAVVPVEPSLVVGPPALIIDEGGSERLSVRLGSRPSGDVDVSVMLRTTAHVTHTGPRFRFTPESWNQPQHTTITVHENDKVGDEVATVTFDPSGADYNGVGDVVVNVRMIDNDGPAVDVTPIDPTVDEGESGQLSVRLGRRPSADVDVSVMLHTTAHVTHTGHRFRFTPESWKRPQHMTITVHENDKVGDEVATVTFDPSGPGFNRDKNVVVNVRLIDNDESEVAVTPAVLTVDEGRAGLYSVALNNRPTADVDVTIGLDPADQFSIDPPRLRFTPDDWDQPRSVEVRAGEDDDAVDEEATVTFTVSGSGFDGTETATVRANDDEEAGVKVAPKVSYVREGGARLISVALTSRPTANVTVQIRRDTNEHITISRGRLRFTPRNWNRRQWVRLHARQDADAVDDVTIFTFAASGGDYGGDHGAREYRVLRVRTNDDEEAPGLVVAPDSLTVDEGGTATYDVALSMRPAADVEVRISVDASRDFSVDRQRLVFTPESWETPQTVTLRAYEDADATDDAAVVTHVASGGGYGGAESVEVTVRAIDHDRGLPAELTVATTLVEHRPRVAADFCMTPLGVGLDELSDFQLARVTRDAEPHSVLSDPKDGVFVYNPVPAEVGACNGGRGVRMTRRYHPDLTYLVRTRARTGSHWVVSDLVTVRVHDPESVLKARLRGDGFEDEDSNGESVFPDVPQTVHGEFEIAAAFGFWVHLTPHADRVNGLALDDFVATNATLSAPPGGFEFQTDLGYRLRVTPTTLGEDVTVQVRAGAVTEPLSGKTNLESNVFRRRTAPPPAGRFAAQAGQPAVEVSVADASAREGADATVSFPVRLSRPALGPVSVRYATSDGTARAGEDYLAVSGTLTFRPGDLVHPVVVSVLDDAKDEGEETFTLTLSDPGGASIADGVATGTIVNTDPLPQEWVTRFGRTVAAQAVDAIGARASGAQGTQIVVAGTPVERSGSILVDPGPRGLPRHSSDFENRNGSWASGWGPGMTIRQLALTSEFRIESEPAEDAPVWTTWGRVAATGFKASPEGLVLDGDVATGFLGFDVARERWLSGVAVSLSRGDGSFELRETLADVGIGGGSVESRLTSLYPYARYRLGEHTDVWAMAGYGTGELTLAERTAGNPARNVVTTTGMSMRMGALGARGRVVSPEDPGDLEVAVRTDAFWVRTQSDAVASANSRRLEASTGDASRVRLLLEGSRTAELGDSGATFTPSAEVGLRHDGGDAETGTGVVGGVGARLAAPGVAVEVAVSSLIAHDEREHEGWGVSGSIRIDPGATGRGLSLSVAPRWGASVAGVERLWSRDGAVGLADGRESGSGDGLAAELGYGLRAPAGRGVLTPYMGGEWSDGGVSSYRLGARWTIAPRTTLGLEGSRRVAQLRRFGGRTSGKSITWRFFRHYSWSAISLQIVFGDMIFSSTPSIR